MRVLLALAWVCLGASTASAAQSAGGGRVPLTTIVRSATTTSTTAPPPPTYPPVTVLRSAPVRGVVTDPWRPPSGPYGPGNRGIDVATSNGAIVRSPADGVVSFAGAVGNSRFVVVASEDGIRITLAFLASAQVRTGQNVRRGQPVGRSSGSVHIGARVGDDYVDPTPLFRGGPPHLRLVPVRR